MAAGVEHKFNGPVECPICFKSYDNLLKLNKHLDVDHLLQTESEPPHSEHTTAKSGRFEEQNIRSSPPAKKRIRNDHWEKYVSKVSVCARCHKVLENTIGHIHCKRCGRLYCYKDGSFRIKLNTRAEYTPNSKGKWFNCCHDCFMKRPGFRDVGQYVDKTSDFKALRDTKLEDSKLRLIQLEERLIKLIDGLTELYLQTRDDFWKVWRINREIESLERRLVPWKDDESAKSCKICHESFSALLRKHHCRLCGEIVCNGYETNCSNDIKLMELAQIASDLPYRDSTRLHILDEIPANLKVCIDCIHTIYKVRKYHNESREETKSVLLRKYQTICDTANVIRSIMPRFRDLLTKLETQETPEPGLVREVGRLRQKLVSFSSNYNTLLKQLAAIEPCNGTEKHIQESIKLQSQKFITETLLPLNTMPQALLQNSTTPKSRSPTSIPVAGAEIVLPDIRSFADLVTQDMQIKEIKQYREELMVLQEQAFLLENAIKSHKRQRKFDEVQALTTNLRELGNRMLELRETLGDQGFE